MQAVALGQLLIDKTHIIHVMRDHPFKNEHLFYRFLDDDKDRGHTEEVSGPEKD